MLSPGIRRTCPSHLSRRRLISRTALLQPVLLWKSTLEILFSQIIRQIFLRHPLWNASIFAMSPLTTRQHSEPYSRMDFILVLQTLSFVLVVYLLDFQMFCSLAKAQRALPSLALMSLPSLALVSFWHPLSLLMRLPR